MIDIFSKINADTSDPDQIALRSYMKGHFLNVFSQVDQSLPGWPDAKVVIYGSTLMRHLMFNDHITFPLSGIKSSDVDIGVMEAPYKRSHDFLEKITAQVGPIVRTAISKSGFHYINSKGEEISNGDIEQLDPENFIGDFFVKKTFAPDEILRIMDERPYYYDLIGYVPLNSVEVKLVLGVNNSPFPIMLNPSLTTPESGQGGFLRARTLDMLAGKIVRSMTDKYKPSDLIDIYNMVSGVRPNGQEFLNFTPDDPKSEIDVVRAMIVAYMPVSRGVHPERSSLLHAFEAKEPDAFMDSVKGQIAENKWDLLRSKVPAMYASIQNLLANVMAKRSDHAIGPLNLTPEEGEFFDKISGLETVRTLERPGKPAWSALGRIFRAARDPVYKVEKRQAEAVIDVDLLEKKSPEIFVRYPELRSNIGGNAILKDRVEMENNPKLHDPEAGY